MRERRKREQSSIAVAKLSPATGPTPGIAMKRRQSSLRATIFTTKSCIVYGALQAAAVDLVQVDAEGLERAADGVFQVEELALEVTPLGQQKPQPLALLALHVGALLYQPVRTTWTSTSASVASILLRCAVRAACMMRLQIHCLDAEHCQLQLQLWRQCAGFMTDPPQARQEGFQPFSDRLWHGRDRDLGMHRALAVDHADRHLVDDTSTQRRTPCSVSCGV